MIGAALYVVLRVLAQFRVLVVPLLISLLLVALVRPLYDALHALRRGRFGLPRSLAAALTVLLSLSLLAGLITLISQQIVTGFPSLREQAAEGLQDIRRRLATGPLHLTSGQLDSYVNALIERLRANSEQVVSGAVQVTATAMHVGAGILLVLFATFFLLAGGEGIWAWTVGLFPRGARRRVDEAGVLAWRTLTSFIRATVVVAAADGLGVAIVAKLLGVPLSIPLGVLVFLGAFVPIVGSLFSGSVAVLVAFVADGPVLALAMLVGVLAVVQLEGHVLQPFLLGRAVRVHPLAVIIVITAGAMLAGIPGALFAVPVTAVANTVTSYLIRTARAADGRDDGGGDGVAPAAPLVPAAPASPAVPRVSAERSPLPEGGQQTEPDTVQPDTVQPDAVQPDAVQPDPGRGPYREA